jgi:hypothetical protein
VAIRVVRMAIPIVRNAIVIAVTVSAIGNAVMVAVVAITAILVSVVRAIPVAFARMAPSLYATPTSPSRKEKPRGWAAAGTAAVTAAPHNRPAASRILIDFFIGVLS